MVVRRLRAFAVASVSLLLCGCNAVILNPAADIAVRERNLIIASTGLMLIIILPVLVFTLLFAWRYRATNTSAAYAPDWHHSTQLELLIWTAPLLIVVALGAMTWMGTHLLDPFRPVAQIDAEHPIPAGTKPLTIDVVALDWKWLFFYPDQGIATVNDLSMPVGVPVTFHITSATVMNSFFVPALAGQIYAMAGMETKLSTYISKTGDFNGMSSQYSGAGFSHMNFGAHGLTSEAFAQWVTRAKAKGSMLNIAAYQQLEKPSEQVPDTYFSSFQTDLFNKILNMCATPGMMCHDEMMSIDASGGGGKNSEANYARLVNDAVRSKEGNEAPGATFPASGRPPNSAIEPQGMKPREAAPVVNQQISTPNEGQGQNVPGAPNQSPAPAQLNDR